MPPHLFILYTEAIFQKATLEEDIVGTHVGGRLINNLRYADDTTLLTETKEDMDHQLRKVRRKSKDGTRTKHKEDQDHVN